MTAALVREMTLADCDRVSEIRIRGWQTAYRGLMPPHRHRHRPGAVRGAAGGET
ncbi:hypothetical protein SAURM35S_02305 [Streptomyces aurantiogriseus]